MESAEAEVSAKKDSEPKKQTSEKKPAKVHVIAPFQMNDCLICKELQKQGDNGDLFLNNIGNFPTGCPEFLSLPQKDKFKLAKDIGMCLT